MSEGGFINLCVCGVMCECGRHLCEAVVAEDIGRQILTYGERKSPAEFIAQVKALTPAEVSAVAAQALKSTPTLCIIGDLSTAPRYEAVKAMF